MECRLVPYFKYVLQMCPHQIIDAISNKALINFDQLYKLATINIYDHSSLFSLSSYNIDHFISLILV